MANPVDTTIAVGYKSGFIRIFDISTENKLVHENMVFESAVKDIVYNQESKFMAVFHKNCKVVIFAVEKNY